MAFSGNANLTSVTIPDSVTTIGSHAFGGCFRLASVNFRGNPPSLGASVFLGDNHVTVYYLPDSTGWGSVFAGRPAVLWNPPMPFTYEVFNDKVAITGYIGSDEAVTIPSTINFLPVTFVGRELEQNMAWGNLTSLTFPNSVSEIGDFTFLGSNLNNIRLNNGLKYIGVGAFAGTGLTNIIIPYSVTYIGALAFGNCVYLTGFNVNWLNSVYSSKDGVLFNKNQTTLVMYPGGRVGAYKIPDKVTEIAGGFLGLSYNGAFEYCSGLTSINIGNNVTSIHDGAFIGCASLTNVVIGNRVKAIGEYSFFDCENLVNITLGSSVRSIGEEAFLQCYSLAGVVIPNSVTNIGVQAFLNCSSLASVTLPNQLTSIRPWVFSGCSSLTNITIPDSVTNIEDGAFGQCYSLTSIIIPSSVTSIGQYAFGDCGGLAGVYFEGNAPTVSWLAFFYANPVAYYLPGTTGWEDFAFMTGLTIMPWPTN